VLSASIHRYASIPVSITPIRLSQLKNIFSRKKTSIESTDFSFSRFLTPYLSNFEGYSIFMDCDMLFFDDVYKLYSLMRDKYSLMVAKHNYIPKSDNKFLDNKQTTYEKKNHSSLMIFNNAKCKILTPNYVNSASGLELHQFKWIKNDALIGEIDIKWNYLVGEYKEKNDIYNAHYTLGGPYFEKYENTDYANRWKDALSQSLFTLRPSSFMKKIYKELK